MFALLLGIGAIFAALRRRRARALYPETYAQSGGVIYTAAQMGCGVMLFVAGAGLIALGIFYHPR